MDKTIGIAMIAWPNHPKRIGYFRETVNSLMEHLSASRHNLRIVCSAESQPDPARSWHGDELESICRENGIALSWRQGRPDLGANQNAAIRLCQTDFVLLVQDDRPLLEPLDLSIGADLLAADKSIDMIRYSWPEAEWRTKFTTHPSGLKQFLPGGNFYGDDPNLRRWDFMEKRGWYAEGETYHAKPERILARSLIAGNAVVLAYYKIYFSHNGLTTAVPGILHKRNPERNR